MCWIFTALIPGLFDANIGITSHTRIGLDYKGNSETFKYVTKIQMLLTLKITH
jgi:hypothetical protein